MDNHSNNIIITNNLEVRYIDLGRTFIINNPNNYQLDKYKYFELLIKLSILVLNINIDTKKDILNLIFKEFAYALGNIPDTSKKNSKN